jgi:hypothetical protein
MSDTTTATLAALRSIETLCARVVSSVHGVLNSAETDELYRLRRLTGQTFNAAGDGQFHAWEDDA